MKPSTEKRLIQYALKFKKEILIGFFCLMIAVTLELAGPLIAKKVIDDHILGVEGYWVEVKDRDNQTVPFQDSYYKRADRLTEEEDIIGDPVTILHVGTNYVY